MPYDKSVTIDLGFDCTPPPESEDTPWDIAVATVAKIDNFLGGEPEGSNSKERFDSWTKELFMRVYIPVDTITDAISLETKLINNIGQFPPELPSQLHSFNYKSKNVPEPEEPEEP